MGERAGVASGTSAGATGGVGATGTPGTFSMDVLRMDLEAEAVHICDAIRRTTATNFRKRGLVLGVSGGIDSACCGALAARALGAARVQCLLMPERDSSPGSLIKGKALCDRFGLPYEIVDLTPALEAMGCYAWRDRAIRRIAPEYRPGDRFKIAVAGDVLGSDRLNYFTLVVELSATGQTRQVRMPVDVYLEIVAATNMKQRLRKATEYSHADRLNYGVVGTPQRLEYDQGFFVRGGDGLADIKPIAHLYKTQVYALSRHLGVPDSICTSTPSTDTYSLPQTQEEFFYALPYERMDLALWAYTNGVRAEEAGRVMGLSGKQVERVYRDIEAKRRMSRVLGGPAELSREFVWGGRGSAS